MKDLWVRRYLVPLVFGLGGFAVLCSFGVWQVQRLAWKEGLLAEIEARIGDAPVALPENPTLEADRFRSVRVTGDYTGQEVSIFTTINEVGQAIRVVAAFETSGGRRIMVERGVLPGRSSVEEPSLATDVTVTGNLHWPDDVDRWTPAPDPKTGLLFGRDVAMMADILGTEPVLVVAREVSKNDPPLTLVPVTTAGIPNNHLGYAVQWFGLAAVWAGMTMFLLWRIRKRTV